MLSFKSQPGPASLKRSVLGTALLAALLAGCAEPPPGTAAEPATKTVSLVIDYRDGVQKRFSGLPWRENMTVLDAMTRAQDHPRGIKFEVQGSGAGTFLTRIDDLANEGGGEQAKNWTYRVNGKLAQKGIGAYDLQPADEVAWKYEVFKGE